MHVVRPLLTNLPGYVLSCRYPLRKPGVVNRTRADQKSIEPNRIKSSDWISISSVIEHNRTETFRRGRLSSITEPNGIKWKRLVSILFIRKTKQGNWFYQIFVHNRQCFTLAGMKLTLIVAQNSLDLLVFAILLQQARWCGCKTFRMNLLSIFGTIKRGQRYPIF